MELKISDRQVGGITVLDLNGRLVLGDGTSGLRDKLKTLTSEGRKKILLNLKGLSYIDSSGLGALVGGYATVKGQQGDIKLVSLDGRVHDLLRVTKLLTVFEVFDDEGKAIASFR